MITGGIGFAFLLDDFPKETLFFLAVICPIILSLVFSFIAMNPNGENAVGVPLAVLCWLMSLAMMAYSWDFWDHIVSKVSDGII
jgi:predicted transporter